MKAVILAGGMGTRFSEETVLKPKPMIEIGEKPILWHIMKLYDYYGITEFIICCGYKGPIIKEYFIKYPVYQSNSTIHLNESAIDREMVEPWKVTLVNTGLRTLTAGRVLRAREYIGNEPFMLTYGDGVSNVNLCELLEYHKSHGRIATISTTQPSGRFGAIKLRDDGMVENFKEKARKDQSWVNMGYMVFNPEIFDYLGDGSQMLEAVPFEQLALSGEMMAYKHEGFWSPMDTVHDKEYLEGLWKNGTAPWKVWE